MLSLTSFSLFRRAPPWSPTCSGCSAIFRRRPLPTLPCRAPTAVGRLPLGPRAPRLASLLRLRAASAAAAHGRLTTVTGAGRAGPAIPRCPCPGAASLAGQVQPSPAPSSCALCSSSSLRDHGGHVCSVREEEVEDDLITSLPLVRLISVVSSF